MDINRNNYETFFLLYLDRELNTADRIEVENFLNENADLQKEFRLLQNTVQWPAEIVFEQKETLYRKEEKRRVLPVYWVRMAAAITLILAGSWFMMTILKSHKTNISPKEQPVATLDSKKKNITTGTAEKMNQANQEGNRENDPSQNQTKQKEIPVNPDQSGQIEQKDMAGNRNPGKSSSQAKRQKQNGVKDQAKISGEQKSGNQEISNGQNQETGNGQINSAPEEALIAVQKSNAALELQTSGNRSSVIEPGSVQALSGAQTPALLIAVVGKGSAAGNENDMEPDIQTDNAISVVALNDRNKAIAGFFNKLTKRAPADETANNSKKMRVSVFQFSY